MTSSSEDSLMPWVEADVLLEALMALPRKPSDSQRRAVAALVDHEDADIREEALRRLGVMWRDVTVHEAARTAVLNDDEVAVRTTAAFALGATATAETRAAASDVLKGIVLSEKEPIRLRGAAYEALLLLYGRRDFPPVTRDIDLETEVDWEWLEALGR